MIILRGAKFVLGMALSMSCSRILSELIDKGISAYKKWWHARHDSVIVLEGT